MNSKIKEQIMDLTLYEEGRNAVINYIKPQQHFADRVFDIRIF